MPGEYEMHLETQVDATPEQVWDALATGSGIDSWFMGRTEVEAGPGGTVRTDLGGFVQESTITHWEPGRRFGYRSATAPDGSFLAIEWLIEGRAGASTVLRSVGSGFIASADWDGEYESLKSGGTMYFHSLTEYVTHFAGRTAVPVSAVRPYSGNRKRMWTVINEGLGLPAFIAPGDPVRLTPTGLDALEGVIDYTTPQFLGVRTADGLYRFFPARGNLVTVGHHLFTRSVHPGQIERSWQSWLARLFPSPAEADGLA